MASSSSSFSSSDDEPVLSLNTTPFETKKTLLKAKMKSSRDHLRQSTERTPLLSSSGGGGGGGTAESSSSQRSALLASDGLHKECPICYDSFPRPEMRGFLDCPEEHLVCSDCMSTYLTSLITDASTVNRITCPATGCNVPPAHYEIEALVPVEIYQKYLEFTALDSLKKEKGVRWCPNKECQNPIVWDETLPTVTCPACHTAFCYHCNAPPHDGRRCDEPDPQKQQQQQQKGQSSGAEGKEGSGSHVDSDLEYKKWKEQQGTKVKPCPGCRMDVEKNLGCQHMTCANCRHQWCWLCQMEYSPTHFGEGSLCQGLQFSPYDSIEEALAAQGRSVAEATRLVRSRRQNQLVRKIVGYTLLAPFLVVGGIVVLGGAIVILPFAGIVSCFKC